MRCSLYCHVHLVSLEGFIVSDIESAAQRTKLTKSSHKCPRPLRRLTGTRQQTRRAYEGTMRVHSGVCDRRGNVSDNAIDEFLRFVRRSGQLF